MAHYTEARWDAKYHAMHVRYDHDGDPRRPHGLFASKLHSGQVFYGEMLTQHPHIFSLAAEDLVEKFIADEGNDPNEIDVVIGPAVGGVIISYEIARLIGHRKKSGVCRTVFCQKQIDNDGQEIMVIERHAIREGERLLIGDDTATDGGTKERTKEAIIRKGGIVLPNLLLFFNRSGLQEIAGLKITALVSQHLPATTAEDCRYCKIGSVAKRLKTADDWNEFTREY